MANNKTKKKDDKNTVAASKAESKKASAKKAAPAKKSAKKKDAKPGFFGKIKKYFISVKTEMKRVVWPSKKELINYSVAVVASLIVVGVVIALLDLGIEGILAAVSSLRG